MNRLNPLLYLALTGLGAWLLLAAAYSLRGEFRLNVGELGDGPYVSGFQGDEAGQPRYRWTGRRANPCDDTLNPAAVPPVNGLITLPLALKPDAPGAVRLTLRAAANPPLVTALVNGIQVGQARAEAGLFKTVEFAIPPGAARPEGTRLEVRSAAFKPVGDCRILGVQVSEVRLMTAPDLRLPPPDAALWAWLYSAAIGLVLLRVAGPGPARLYWAAGAGASLLIPWLLLPLLVPAGLNLWYTPFLLPAIGLGGAGLVIWLWRAAVGEWLARWLDRLESHPRLARNILLVALLAYSLLAFGVVMNTDFIGHADYADNAVAARNIVRGRGYSLDYAAQFYQMYSLPRPADTWPPLQPWLITPFYLIYGPTVWAAKFPNLLLAPALAWAIFSYGARLFGRRAALGASLLSLVTVVPAFSAAPAVFETIAYPINDLAFTLLAFLALINIWLAATGNRRPDPAHLNGTGPAPLSPAETGPPGSFDKQRTIASFSLSEKEAMRVMKSGNTPDTPAPRARHPSEKVLKHKSPAGFVRNQIVNLKSPIVNLNPWVRAGLWSGLLVLCKPSGALLLAGAGLWLLARKYLGPDRRWLSWRNLWLLAGAALLVVSPYLVRNLLQFGAPYRSTEQYDAWVTKWNPPDERIYDLFRPFADRELPNPRHLLEYGWDNNLNAINNQFKKFFTHLLEGQLYSPLLLGLVLIGLAALAGRRSGLPAMLGAGLLAYLLFINIFWHYEPRYFLFGLPWLLLFGLYGLVWLYDKISAGAGAGAGAGAPAGRRNGVKAGPQARAGMWLVTAVWLVLALPGTLFLINDSRDYTSPSGMVAVSNWIKRNTPANAVIMSRNVWELSFHAERHSVMVPNNASLDQIKNVMRTYRAAYLQLDHLGEDDRSINRQWGQRRALWPLLDLRPEYEGFKLLYNQGGLAVYEWNGR